jgi:transposase InsO family protein
VILERIWLVANRPCAVRLQPMLDLWMGSYEQEHGRVAPALRQRLLGIRARTLDRLMQPVRKRHGVRGKCGTRPGTLLKKQIPIKTHHADVTQPGVLEADTVAHCGSSLEGNFVWSLTMTDIHTGWTQNRAVWNRGYEGVKAAIHDIEETLPFRLTGFHSDNGGEFINHHLLRYLQDRQLPILPTRSRPNHKDDNAHVEQKNYTHVRLLLGYERMEDPDLIAPINRLYALWGLFNNLFCASRKLIEKKKTGSRYLKRYDQAATPCQRLLDSPHVDEAKKTYLTELRCNHSPFALKRQIDHLQDQILRQFR